MNCDWQKDLELKCFAHAGFVPPAMFGEAAWDCLLALYADERRELGRLAGAVQLILLVKTNRLPNGDKCAFSLTAPTR